jgi:outer membrane protein OmpA-like peptidoglycan-associated protein
MWEPVSENPVYRALAVGTRRFPWFNSGKKLGVEEGREAYDARERFESEIRFENCNMVDISNEPPNQERQEAHHASAKTQSRPGLLLGAIAVGIVLVLGFWLLRSLGRLNRQMAQLSQQTEQLNRRVESAELQSQSLARQASQAAANAQTAAQQRDEAKQSEANSAVQTQSALQAAAAAQLQANQAEQKAEDYRKQREEELHQLQQVLGQIAETHRTALGLVMTLGEKSIRFAFDKSDIEPQYHDILNRIAGVLMTLKGYSIYVYGYTDDIGTQDYNLKLSGRRAQAVRDSLVQAGINPGLITTKGFGKSDPRVKGDAPQARAANRRVEIGIVDSRLLFEPLPEK